jgi:hypothetical protein
MSAAVRPASLPRRIARFLRREAWILVIGLLAFVTRIAWNTAVHPPRNFVYSDMAGYFTRAVDVATQPLTATYDYLAFYPWGAHAYLGLVKALFTTPKTCPRELLQDVAKAGCAPMDVAMAVAGAIGVVYTTLIARRLTQRTPERAATGRRRWVYVVVGFAALLYYPLLAQGSYYLSEVPFFACLAAATFHSLRLADEGKTSDAVLFGVFAGLGTWVRPQMLMSLALLGLFWLFRRRQLPGATLKRLLVAAVPLALLLVLSAVRTTRHARAHDKREFALVSTNDALNYTFGRCHSIGIETRTKNYRAAFGPPSLGSLYFGVRELRKKKQPVFIELKPALPDDLRCEVNKKHLERKEPTEPCILIEGKMWDRDKLRAIAARCVEKTGLAQQAYYAMTHVLLNFGFNHTWPDSGQKLRKVDVLGLKIPYGGPIMKGFQLGFGVSLMPLGILACLLAFRKKRARDALLALHFWACLLVAALYFGETRLRTPYDFVFLILGLDLLSRMTRWTGRKLAKLLPR